MRNWKQFSEDLEEWKGSHVTETLREAMRKVAARRKAALTEAYLSGNQQPGADRKALLLVEQWVEDFFESTAEDVRAVMEHEDEKPERD